MNQVSRDELWKLYELALRDRDFQVTITWDRTKHYFLFNFAAFSVAGALATMKGAFSVIEPALLLLVALNSICAAIAIRKGHTYYRNSRRHLHAIESRLGLGSDETLKGTRGMARPEGPRPLRDSVTIVNLSIALQLYIAGAAMYALYRIH